MTIETKAAIFEHYLVSEAIYREAEEESEGMVAASIGGKNGPMQVRSTFEATPEKLTIKLNPIVITDSAEITRVRKALKDLGIQC